ncbi:MAG: 3-hydroxyacyl-CoA dehydrogenase NAD-binding domain-containing protein [Syntrophorhabdales bacterium]
MARSEHIAVVGAGLMGHAIAQVFASKGHEVSLTDVNDRVLGEALENIRINLSFLAENGIGAAEDIEPVLKNIRITPSLREAVTGARFVVEAVCERLDLKQGLFVELEQYCSPQTVFATNTSTISITEIAAKVRKKERVVGTHFWNPPYLIPLVEVIGGRHTSAEVVDYTFDLLKTAGKHPVRVKKDVPGFVGNRLQHALWREAVSIVDQGIADAATVDEVIKNSFGIRLPVLAPLETADMVGLDLTLQIHEYILKRIDRSMGPAALLRRKVEKGELGFKTGKGFYEWDREKVEQCKHRLLQHLVRWMREHETG